MELDHDARPARTAGRGRPGVPRQRHPPGHGMAPHAPWTPSSSSSTPPSPDSPCIDVLWDYLLGAAGLDRRRLPPHLGITSMAVFARLPHDGDLQDDHRPSARDRRTPRAGDGRADQRDLPRGHPSWSRSPWDFIVTCRIHRPRWSVKPVPNSLPAPARVRDRSPSFRLLYGFGSPAATRASVGRVRLLDSRPGVERRRPRSVSCPGTSSSESYYAWYSCGHHRPPDVGDRGRLAWPSSAYGLAQMRPRSHAPGGPTTSTTTPSVRLGARIGRRRCRRPTTYIVRWWLNGASAAPRQVAGCLGQGGDRHRDARVHRGHARSRSRPSSWLTRSRSRVTAP